MKMDSASERTGSKVMRTRTTSRVLFAFLFCLAAAGVLRAGEDPRKEDAPTAPLPAKPTQDKKAVLLDATRASTAAAAESASQKESQETPSDDTPKPPEDPAVTELRPLPPDSQARDSDKDEAMAKKSKLGPLKNIHGTVYGGAGGAGKASGGAVGGSTKSGETSIYVEGQRTKTR